MKAQAQLEGYNDGLKDGYAVGFRAGREAGLTRVYFCEEWEPKGRYWKAIFCTDDARSADRWRRNGTVGYERKFSDYIVLNRDEVEVSEYLKAPEGESQER